MTAYIDLDIVLYRCLFATKDQNYYAQLRACDNTVQNIVDHLQPDDFELVLTGPGNFRYKIYSEYKANRKDTPRPEYLQDAKYYFIKYWNETVLATGIEADDHIAMNYQEGDIIVSTDKDFLQLPAVIHNWVKNKTFKVENPMKNFFLQMLTGDAADNVPGLPNPAKAHYKSPPNFTEGTAEPLLKGDVRDMDETVRQLYYEVYGDGWYEHYDVNARLLWLKRSPDDEYYKWL